MTNYTNTTGTTEPETTDRQFEFYNSAFTVFIEAEQKAGGSVERYFSIGGFTVKLRFAGSALVPKIIPALEHLSSASSSAASLTICLWDSESTGTTMPAPPWSIDDYNARGEVKDFNGGRYLTACNKGSGALSVLDKSSDTALWWIRNSSNVPFYETGSPLLTILHWWLQQKERQVVHAGAVGTRQAGVLMVGKSGSGKSTSSIACINSDLFYAGDDYCILSAHPAPHVYSLYNSGKLNADHIRNFPHLIPAVSNMDRIDEEKPLVLMNKHFPQKLINELPISAIFLPRITGLTYTTITQTTQAAALKALAPNTLFQLSNASHKSFSEIVRFVKQLPCFYLNLGTELDQIPQVISHYLSGH